MHLQSLHCSPKCIHQAFVQLDCAGRRRSLCANSAPTCEKRERQGHMGNWPNAWEYPPGKPWLLLLIDAGKKRAALEQGKGQHSLCLLSRICAQR